MLRSARHRQFRALFLLCGSLLAMNLSGCGWGSGNGSSDSTAIGEFDLQHILSHYREANHYSDDASVVLHYSLDGAPFEEIHPCKLQIARDQSYWSQRFKLEVCSQNDLSVARVMDPQTQNLGGQVICLPGNHSQIWTTILEDPIAYHFSHGGEDVPWNDELLPETIHQFLSLPSSLFNGNQPAWMSSDRLTETTEVEVEGVKYVDAVFETPYGQVACRFDFRNRALVGVRFPPQILSTQLASTPGVRDVSLAILFQNVSFENCHPRPPAIQANEQAVRGFIQLPEEFPSPVIGKSLQAWGLVDIDQIKFDPKSAWGVSAVYFYGLQQQYAREELESISSLVQQNPSVNFAWISPINGPVTNKDTSNGSLQFTRMGYFFDTQGEFLQQLNVNNPQFCLIANAKGEIQFVAVRKKGWLDQVNPLLKRIGRGDDVAREMHNEYSKYHTEYHDRLEAVRADQSLVESLRQQ